MRCKRGLTSPFGPSAKRENAAPWCARATPNDNGLIIRLRAPSLVFWPFNGIHKKAKKKKKKKEIKVADKRRPLVLLNSREFVQFDSSSLVFLSILFFKFNYWWIP
jgi:hypothetical protein